jgi:ATP-dependent protease ClpP protease subunit
VQYCFFLLQIQTVAVGAAIGQACLLLAAGEKGRRYMMPHATAMIQQPRLPSTGQMSAIDVHIRAKEVPPSSYFRHFALLLLMYFSF